MKVKRLPVIEDFMAIVNNTPSVSNYMSTLKKSHNLRKVNVHKSIALDDENTWNEVDVGI